MKNSTLKELLIGIGIYGCLAQLVLLILGNKLLYRSIGIWTGIGIAMFMAIHINRTLEDALDLGSEGAIKHVKKGYGFRVLVALVVMGVLIFFDLGDVFGAVIGIFSLKIAAYLQPLMHKFLMRFQGKIKKEKEV